MPIMIRDFNNLFAQMSGMPINSRDGRNLLKNNGIDTNSKQYQAVMKRMNASVGAGVGYTNPQAIKNLMKSYDKDGNYISPSSGLAGLTVTEENIAQKHHIISILESSREEMYEVTKREFLNGNGIADAETTKRSDVYINLYKKMPVKDRLAAGNSLRQYERAYRQAFIDAAKAVDPKWELGKPIEPDALDNVSREDIDSSLKKTDGRFVQSNIDLQI
ncbi:MAG: DUF3879 family protein [Lachnospiraceae bacterium]|nr:DUF3879 family protein [Lachnospiraceae bacterium]